jgi:hypothetical protein
MLAISLSSHLQVVPLLLFFPFACSLLSQEGEYINRGVVGVVRGEELNLEEVKACTHEIVAATRRVCCSVAAGVWNNGTA